MSTFYVTSLFWKKHAYFKNNQAVYTANTLLDCYLDIMVGELENQKNMNSPSILV